MTLADKILESNQCIELVADILAEFSMMQFEELMQKLNETGRPEVVDNIYESSSLYSQESNLERAE